MTLLRRLSSGLPTSKSCRSISPLGGVRGSQGLSVEGISSLERKLRSNEILNMRNQVDQLPRNRRVDIPVSMRATFRRVALRLKAFRARDVESPNIRAVSGSLMAK